MRDLLFTVFADGRQLAMIKNRQCIMGMKINICENRAPKNFPLNDFGDKLIKGSFKVLMTFHMTVGHDYLIRSTDIAIETTRKCKHKNRHNSCMNV